MTDIIITEYIDPKALAILSQILIFIMIKTLAKTRRTRISYAWGSWNDCAECDSGTRCGSRQCR